MYSDCGSGGGNASSVQVEAVVEQDEFNGSIASIEGKLLQRFEAVDGVAAAAGRVGDAA